MVGLDTVGVFVLCTVGVFVLCVATLKAGERLERRRWQGKLSRVREGWKRREAAASAELPPDDIEQNRLDRAAALAERMRAQAVHDAARSLESDYGTAAHHPVATVADIYRDIDKERSREG